MSDLLAPDLLTIAFCWRLERLDGVALGFTTHDRDLRRGGLIYRAAPGMLPSEISMSDGFEADSLDIKGALTSDAISAADLAAGRWDGALVQVFMVDWESPDGDVLNVARGELGEVSIMAGAFEAELRGPVARLDAPVAEQTSPACRARLGDRRCRVDMAGRTRLTRIVANPAADQVEVAEAGAGDEYGAGRLRWLGGPNSGLETRVLRSEGPVLILDEPPAFPPAAGDLVEIAEGCDKLLATCAGRFANAANFRGEPHLPGIDLLTRYPGA
jgi:uncharacterized phage protein (TIGR02218 family)